MVAAAAAQLDGVVAIAQLDGMAATAQLAGFIRRWYITHIPPHPHLSRLLQPNPQCSLPGHLLQPRLLEHPAGTTRRADIVRTAAVSIGAQSGREVKIVGGERAE